MSSYKFLFLFLILTISGSSATWGMFEEEQENNLNILNLGQETYQTYYSRGISAVEEGEDEEAATLFYKSWDKDEELQTGENPIYELAELVANWNGPLANFYLGLWAASEEHFTPDVLMDFFSTALAVKNRKIHKEAKNRLKELVEQPCDRTTHNYDSTVKQLVKFDKKYCDSDVQYYLGAIYYNEFIQAGNNDVGTLKQAVHWYNKSANNGDADADSMLRRFRQKECKHINSRPDRLDVSIGRIVLFRGIHFVKNLFDTPDKIQRIVNMPINEDTFLVSSAACKLAGKEFLAELPGEEELETGKVIAEILKKFKSQSQDLYNFFHQTYTNDHKKFHTLLKNPKEADVPSTEQAFTEYRWIFENYTAQMYPKTWHKAVKRNPFVSFSCNAEHAVKYEAGGKKFTGGKKVKRNPEYEVNGVPTNPHLGRLFVAEFSAHDLWSLEPTFVINKHAQGKINVSININNISTEDEVSFFGYIPPGFIKSSRVLKIDKLPREERKNYEEINKNFRKKRVKLEDIIAKEVEYFNQKAEELVADEGCLRIYPDLFEGCYTTDARDSENVTIANWLHTINSKKSRVIAASKQGQGTVTRHGVQIFAVNLTRQPLTLETNWMGALKEIDLSSYDLSSSGASFVKILGNPHIRLENLSLVACGLTQEDTKKIALNLGRNQSLKKLILDKNTVKNEGAIIFSNSLWVNKILQELSLLQTGIVDFQCFSDLFPSGGDDVSLNQTLLSLNIDLEHSATMWKKIKRGLNRNKESINTSK